MRILATIAVLAAAWSGFASSASADQLAAATLHPVTIAVEVNTGDAKHAKDVVLTIEPAPGSANLDAKANLKGSGTIQLPEGRYKVVAKLQDTLLEEKFTVAGPTDFKITMKVGFATLALIPRIGGKPLADGVEWKVLTWKKDAKGNRKLVTVPSGNQPSLILPEGWYLVEVTHKGVLTKHTIEMSNGITYAYSILKQ